MKQLIFVTWVGWRDEEKKSYDLFSLSLHLSIEFSLYSQPPQLLRIVFVWKCFRIHVSEDVAFVPICLQGFLALVCVGRWI